MCTYSNLSRGYLLLKARRVLLLAPPWLCGMRVPSTKNEKNIATLIYVFFRLHSFLHNELFLSFSTSIAFRLGMSTYKNPFNDSSIRPAIKPRTNQGFKIHSAWQHANWYTVPPNPPHPLWQRKYGIMSSDCAQSGEVFPVGWDVSELQRVNRRSEQQELTARVELFTPTLRGGYILIDKQSR